MVGASSGIGRAVAVRAVASGALVGFAARREASLAAAVAAAGGGESVVLDVRDESSVSKGVVEAARLLGGLDGVVYAAGMSPLGTVDELDADAWRALLETNVVGAALVARAALPLLAPGGLLAFLSSVSVGRPRRALVGYSASKAALDELVRGIQSEHREVRCLRVVIGDTVGTEFGSSFDADTVAGVLPHWIVEAHLYANQMDADDLGQAIVRALSIAFAHPEIALSDVRLEPAGGMLTLAADARALAAFDPTPRS